MNTHFLARHHENRKQEFLEDLLRAGTVAAVAIAGLTAIIAGLMLVFTERAVLWPSFVHLIASAIFVTFLLGAGLSLPATSRYLFWRALAALVEAVVDRVRHMTRIPPAQLPAALPLQHLNRQQVLTCWRQLRRQRNLRPPGIWSLQKAPLLFFAQVPLLLAP